MAGISALFALDARKSVNKLITDILVNMIFFEGKLCTDETYSSFQEKGVRELMELWMKDFIAKFK